MEEGWGEGGQFIESCSCVHWAFFTSLLPRTANYTNPIRRGNGLFGNYFWKRERKTTHKCKFSDCHLQPLNIQPSTSSCCWRHAWHSSVSPGWAAVRNQGVIFFFFNDTSFLILKNSVMKTSIAKPQCGVAWGARVQKRRLLLEVVPDVTI